MFCIFEKYPIPLNIRHHDDCQYSSTKNIIVHLNMTQFWSQLYMFKYTILQYPRCDCIVQYYQIDEQFHIYICNNLTNSNLSRYPLKMQRIYLFENSQYFSMIVSFDCILSGDNWQVEMWDECGEVCKIRSLTVLHMLHMHLETFSNTNRYVSKT